MAKQTSHTQGALNDAFIIQRISQLKEALQGVILSITTNKRAVLYDSISKRWILLEVEGGKEKISFHTAFPNED